jgi:hypothetical protein
MKIIEAVKEEAAKYGVKLDDEGAEHVLWEETGWPAFWPIAAENRTPEACLRAQVREWAESAARPEPQRERP